MTTRNIRSACIGHGTHHLLEDIADRYDTVQAMEHTPYDVVVLDLPQNQEAQALCDLRRRPAYSHALIYGVRANNGLCQALGDGPLPETHDQFSLEVRTWQERFDDIRQALPNASLEFQVLSWLWTGPERKLYSHASPSSPLLYTYPVLDILAQDNADPYWTLDFMAQQGWLQAQALVDRIRRCTKCGSGHLNYIDVCPDCKSLAIERRPSLHCFVCGHVGAQETFLKDGAMFCPNCFTRLRHIGSDYDRPMENYTCRSCDAFFVDADIQVRCLDCSTSQRPDELRVQPVNTYVLTDAGRMRCRRGVGDTLDLDAQFDFQGLMHMEMFRHALNWLLDIERRYQRPTFSLIGLRMVNLRQTLAAMGERQGYALLDALIARLVEIIRETDRCARSSEDTLWLLMPETNREGAQQALRRLGTLTDLFTQAGVQIEVRRTLFCAESDIQPDDDARLLLGRLSGALHD